MAAERGADAAAAALVPAMEEAWLAAALGAARRCGASGRELKRLQWQAFAASREATGLASPGTAVSEEDPIALVEELVDAAQKVSGLTFAGAVGLRRAFRAKGFKDLDRRIGKAVRCRNSAAHPDVGLMADVSNAAALLCIEEVGPAAGTVLDGQDVSRSAHGDEQDAVDSISAGCPEQAQDAVDSISAGCHQHVQAACHSAPSSLHVYPPQVPEGSSDRRGSALARGDMDEGSLSEQFRALWARIDHIEGTLAGAQCVVDPSVDEAKAEAVACNFDLAMHALYCRLGSVTKEVGDMHTSAQLFRTEVLQDLAVVGDVVKDFDDLRESFAALRASVVPVARFDIQDSVDGEADWHSLPCLPSEASHGALWGKDGAGHSDTGAVDTAKFSNIGTYSSVISDSKDGAGHIGTGEVDSKKHSNSGTCSSVIHAFGDYEHAHNNA